MKKRLMSKWERQQRAEAIKRRETVIAARDALTAFFTAWTHTTGNAEIIELAHNVLAGMVARLPRKARK